MDVGLRVALTRSLVDLIGVLDRDPLPLRALDWGVKNGVEYDIPVPGMPNVARDPRPEKFSVAPCPPTLTDAPEPLKLSRTPGMRRTDRRNRNPISWLHH